MAGQDWNLRTGRGKGDTVEYHLPDAYINSILFMINLKDVAPVCLPAVLKGASIVFAGNFVDYYKHVMFA